MAGAEKAAGRKAGRKQREETVLMAQMMVQLVSGERFELLPFEDANDVKCRVCDLVEDWAKSGSLARGNEIIPRHRVEKAKAERVEELSRDESELRRTEWEVREPERQQQSFWRTKRAKPKEQDSGASTRDVQRLAA